jgi:hypothetical protein
MAADATLLLAQGSRTDDLFIASCSGTPQADCQEKSGRQDLNQRPFGPQPNQLLLYINRLKQLTFEVPPADRAQTVRPSVRPTSDFDPN